jgi:diketogulonate reductase-like aldo/keto reductase
MSPRPHTTEIAPNVRMPYVALGTCCGSDPNLGLPAWINASSALFPNTTLAIDTAYDYDDQADIAIQLRRTKTPRRNVFITTKIPGAAFLNKDPKIVCPSRDFRACALRAVKTDLAQLDVSAVDLLLLHDPGLANETATTAALWQGLQDALRAGLTRSIGVSNFNSTQLDELVAQPTTTTAPAVNQIAMGVGGARPEATLAACARHRITPQAYWTLRNCPFDDPVLVGVARAHGADVSTAMVCIAWVLGRGVLVAAGTGANASKVGRNTREDLGASALVLTADEMARVGQAGLKYDANRSGRSESQRA